MTEYVFEPPPVAAVAIAQSKLLYPVRRIHCVGRNYADHVREMGMDPTRDPPFFFQKPRDAIVANGESVPYPPLTANFHHEIELVVAIGREGADIPVATALDHIFGYAVGNDFTRRDQQLLAREKGRPWEPGKAFDHCAGIAQIHETREVGHPDSGRIWLTINGQARQEADLKNLIWSVPEIVSILSTYVKLMPGDLVYTGTPAGVGPLQRGDVVEGGIDGLGTLINTIR